jgi:NAD-dependent dihydropyrimidine dehydrogenase PreA subunit
MRTLRKIIEIDDDLCNGCGQCVPSCAEGALQVIDGKARLVSEVYCDGLGACLGECPTGALRIVERDAEEFDTEAVEEYLRTQGVSETPVGIPEQGICPSSHVRMFTSPCSQAEKTVSRLGTASALSHWPVQTRLVPPTAPFLRGAHLLIAADCVPVAYADFHSDLLPGKAVMIGCPKFDDAREYVSKFAEIFRIACIQGVTVVVMEVPCCSRLPLMVKKGLEIAGKDIPIDVLVISTQGEKMSA